MTKDTARLMEILERGLGEGLYTGAQAAVSDAGDGGPDVVCVGRTMGEMPRGYAGPVPEDVTGGTLFDIASLTKPLATAGLVMAAVDDGVLSLDRKLVSVPDAMFPSWLLGETLESLLCHRTHLPALPGDDAVGTRGEDHIMARRHFESIVMRMTPRDDGRTWCYSDVGYILLGFVLESVYGNSLDRLFEGRIAGQLGIGDTMCYLPLHHARQGSIAATGMGPHGMVMQGHPDDVNARALTHVAGHAGLFASAGAVSSYVRALLDGCFPVGRDTVSKFLSYRHPDTPFALGWNRPTGDASLSARAEGDPVLGHLGFTGCSVWFDLETGRAVTLLANRTFTGGDAGAFADLRREFYSAAWEL